MVLSSGNRKLILFCHPICRMQVSFCLDRRHHGSESLAYAPLAQFQGPSLLVHNNAVFTEDDFESISRVGDSRKRAQAWKTGRFG